MRMVRLCLFGEEIREERGVTLPVCSYLPLFREGLTLLQLTERKTYIFSYRKNQKGSINSQTRKEDTGESVGKKNVPKHNVSEGFSQA